MIAPGSSSREDARSSDDAAAILHGEYRWKPGQSGNPRGRPSAGAAVVEWINALAETEPTEADLRGIARNKRTSWQKRAAAERMLRMIESGDLADFTGLLKGEYDLRDLRAKGINAEVVEKIKQRAHKVAIGGGEVEVVVEREIELHDRSGADFDRILNRTEGKALARGEVDHRVSGLVIISGEDRIREPMELGVLHLLPPRLQELAAGMPAKGDKPPVDQHR